MSVETNIVNAIMVDTGNWCMYFLSVSLCTICLACPSLFVPAFITAYLSNYCNTHTCTIGNGTYVHSYIQIQDEV